MRLARYADGACFVPGGSTEWVEIDGRTVGIHTAQAYVLRDGSIEPGVLESPIRTELHCLRYPGEPIRFRPLVCQHCGDTGDDPDSDWGCRACHGYAETVNLHRCAHCGEFSVEALPVAPREVVNHPLLLEHMHPACAIEMLLDELVGRGAGRAA